MSEDGTDEKKDINSKICIRNQNVATSKRL